jgi:hypothetical protein
MQQMWSRRWAVVLCLWLPGLSRWRRIWIHVGIHITLIQTCSMEDGENLMMIAVLCIVI